MAGTYSPLTNTIYMPLHNTCARMLATRVFPQGGPYRHQIAPGTENAGTVRAISAETGATVWLHRAARGVARRYGRRPRLRRRRQRPLRVFDQVTGEFLRQVNLGSAVTGFPITYAVDRRQFVAVSTGSVGTSSRFTGLDAGVAAECRERSGLHQQLFARQNSESHQEKTS